MRRRFETLIISGILLLLPVLAAAQRVPHVFVPGEAALAEEVNENFDALAGPDTGTIFIAPKEISSGLGANVQVVLVDTVANTSFTAAFGRPVMAERFEEELLSSRFKPGTANGEGPLLIPWGRYRTYRAGDFKLVKHFMDGKFSTHLFNLKKDPGEMSDLALDPASAKDLAQMEQELKNWSMVSSSNSRSSRV